MAAGERIFMAKESTSQQILLKINEIIESGIKPKRYGMRINRLDSNPDTRVEYLYDAVGMEPAKMNYTEGEFDYGDWGDVWFVKNNRPVMLRIDGTVDYELNHENHAMKLDGSASDISNTSYEGNAMSEIPLIWVKRYAAQNYDYIIFCETQYDETYKAYAHTDADGNILPVTYYPMYEGKTINNRLRSLSGQIPTIDQKSTEDVQAVKQNGDRWDTLSFSEVNLICEMCIMISHSTNSQEKFGMGCCEGDNFIQTGTLNRKGQFFGSTSTTEGVKIFYCENFYGNYWKKIQGIVQYSGEMWFIKPVPIYNLEKKGYTSIGKIADRDVYGDYISRMEMILDIGRLPTTSSGGTENKYECDSFWIRDYSNFIGDIIVAQFGGCCMSGMKAGLSCWNLNTEYDSRSKSSVASVTCKPPVIVES